MSKAKSLAIAAVGIAVPPLGMAYLGYKGLNSLNPNSQNIFMFPHLTLTALAMNTLFIAATELGARSFYKPDPQTAYPTSEITVRYNARENSPQLSLGEAVINGTTVYGFIEPFFRNHTYTQFTELSVTPSPDYSCQWRMDGHVPLERIVETRQHLSSDPEVLFRNRPATDEYIVDHARKTCLAVLAEEKL